MAPSRLLSLKLIGAALCAASVLVVLPASASASPSSWARFHGVVTANTAKGWALRAELHPATRSFGSFNNLQNHGGPVMKSDANRVIYWVGAGGSMNSSYASVINTFFRDITGSNSGKDVYGVDRQYASSTMNPTYPAAPVTDTTPYPASGCHAGSGPCITDAQLQQELQQHFAATGMTGEYFVYFPAGVTTCFDSSGSQCSGSSYCAYHSSIGTGTASTYLYADMPYAGASGCSSGQSPNGNAAGDSAVNVTSHENIETITDPLGNAWYDWRGYEIGDKCAWNFGSPLGGSPGSEWNQQIGAGHYWLQREWSNANGGCVQKY